jgi:hypothetical protein
MSEVMRDPILFWTLCAVIAAIIIVLVLAFRNAIREAAYRRRTKQRPKASAWR